MDQKESLLILDGNSLMNRAFYALPNLTNSKGVCTNAVYGFTTMLLKMKEEINPDYIVCTFDRKVPTFRHNKYKDYKAGRKKMPEELAQQFPIVKELLSKLAINIFEIDGFEADDLIGTLANFAEKQGIQIYIVTGDRDALQLATDNTKVIITKKGITEKEVYDKNQMINEFGVTPGEFIDVKGLMGDKSDNIPGVPGIGPKTAFKLIKEYKSVENVLMNIENIKGKKLKENLIEYSEQAVLSKKLATIVTNVPINIDLEAIKSKEDFDIKGVRRLFLDLQFNSLLDKIPHDKKEDIKIEYKVINNIEDFKHLFNKVIFKIDTLREYIYITFKVINEKIYFKNEIEKMFINFKNKNYVVYFKDIFDLNKKESIEVIKDIFENEEIKKVTYDVKEIYSILSRFDINFRGVSFDAKIAAYLIDPSQSEYSLKSLIIEYLGKDIMGEEEEENIKEIDSLKELYSILKNKIETFGMEKLLYNVEQPLIKVLSSMEQKGFKVDSNKLNELGVSFKKEINLIKTEIYELADEEFNINSPKQLGKILFQKLDLPIIKKTKTGYSTNAAVLEKLIDKHPIIEKIMNYRQFTKLFSTYVEGLKAVIDEDGKIHSNFNQTVTTTGRLSSTEPNLQNIPIKYAMGREIRKVFVPDNDNCVILSADYSQIELRVLAHIAEDENLIDAFKKHADIHTKTASEVFKVPIDEVTSYMRSNAKAVNFGIVYGIGDFSLAKDLKISRKEAKLYIDTYFERYPKVKEYMDNIVKKAEKDMFVTTILNRRRFISEIKASNKIVKSLGKRLAMNTPIQGSAADIIKMAMVNVYSKLEDRKLKSKVILQVHDELILNVYKDELEEVKDIVKKEMEEVFELKVPLEIDINIGDTWYDAK